MQHKLPSVLVVPESWDIKLPVNNSESVWQLCFISLSSPSPPVRINKY